MGVAPDRYHRLSKTYWDHPSPTVWPPLLTYVQTLTMELLPGATFCRNLMWRYSLTWTKPA